MSDEVDPEDVWWAPVGDAPIVVWPFADVTEDYDGVEQMMTVTINPDGTWKVELEEPDGTPDR